MGRLTFIVGGARSGKSTHAEKLALDSGGRVLYVATMQPQDDEMRQRIAAHQGRRPAGWQTIELPVDVGRQLEAMSPQADVILLDCVSLLVSNVLLGGAIDLDHPDADASSARVQSEMDGLLSAIGSIPARWLVVSNEVGQGLVPPYPMGRLYRDLLGWANQRLAQAADEVVWMVAGIPVPVGQYREKM